MARNVRFRFYPPKVQHFRPWKMVVGRLLSYGEGNFSGAMLNFRRVDVSRWWWKKQILGSFDPDFPGRFDAVWRLALIFSQGLLQPQTRVFFLMEGIYNLWSQVHKSGGLTFYTIQMMIWLSYVINAPPKACQACQGRRLSRSLMRSLYHQLCRQRHTVSCYRYPPKN